jgi:iron complex transport system ATP-binding protein
MLDVKNISYQTGNKKILHDICACFGPGLLHVIVGPNGSGKSTLLKIISGEIKPQEGAVNYDNKLIAQIDKPLLAKFRAVMSQLPELYFPLRVDEVVMMGRYPHFTFRPSKKDLSICDEVMRELNVDQFAERDYLSLSGGEKQRIQFARVLAQIWGTATEGQRYLFLDEPVSSLDIHYQHQFLQKLQSLKKENIVLIVVLHDLNLAMQYADRIIFMKDGEIVRNGKVSDSITADLIEDVFNIPVDIIDSPAGKILVYRRLMVDGS